MPSQRAHKVRTLNNKYHHKPLTLLLETEPIWVAQRRERNAWRDKTPNVDDTGFLITLPSGRRATGRGWGTGRGVEAGGRRGAGNWKPRQSRLHDKPAAPPTLPYSYRNKTSTCALFALVRFRSDWTPARFSFLYHCPDVHFI